MSVGLFAEYGAALFLGAPTLSTFLATLLFARLSGPKAIGSLLASSLGFLLSFFVMLAFAIEGVVCLVMAGPLAVVGGSSAGASGSSSPPWPQDEAIRAAPSAMAILPLWLFAEALHPLPQESNRVVESELIIDATPDVVWNRVLAFEELPPPTEPIFLAGVSYPTGATIEGVGVGAVSSMPVCHGGVRGADHGLGRTARAQLSGAGAAGPDDRDDTLRRTQAAAPRRLFRDHAGAVPA